MESRAFMTVPRVPRPTARLAFKLARGAALPYGPIAPEAPDATAGLIPLVTVGPSLGLCLGPGDYCQRSDIPILVCSVIKIDLTEQIRSGPITQLQDKARGLPGPRARDEDLFRGCACWDALCMLGRARAGVLSAASSPFRCCGGCSSLQGG